MRIQLSEHFTYQKLLRFVVPSIVMMVFTSIYGVIDGLFVSNFVNKTAFTAINLIMPYLMIFGALGFMIGTGGSAYISKLLGERQSERASRMFSMLILVTVIGGIAISTVGLLLLRPVAMLMGATGALLDDCILYGAILMAFTTAFMLQIFFQSFFVTAEKPKLGLFFTVLAGCTNIALDALFVGLLQWGLVGAAAATVISQAVGGFLPLLYFARKNTSLLRIVLPTFDLRALCHVMTNGSSELATNLSMSLVNICYNFQLMHYAGEDGVAAYGVLMYVNFIFVSIYIGYSIGVAPVVGYHYGAQNHGELQGLFKKSITLLTVSGIVMTLLAEALASPLSALFVGYDPTLYRLTLSGFMIYSLSYLFAGFNIFGSGFFTALSNGPISALISFLRTLVFQLLTVFILPLFFGVNGVWWSLVTAEMLALTVTASLLLLKRKTYRYL